MTAPRVPPAILARVFWRCLFLQAAWNRRGMQNLGFAYAIDPALRALYPDAATPLRLAFFAFVGVACASGAKALRARRAPQLFFAALGLAVVALAAGRLLA